MSFSLKSCEIELYFDEKGPDVRLDAKTRNWGVTGAGRVEKIDPEQAGALFRGSGG